MTKAEQPTITQTIRDSLLTFWAAGAHAARRNKEAPPQVFDQEAARLVALIDTRTTPLAAQVPVCSIDFQQRRGRAADLIDWAINEYDGFMMDDDYDTQRLVDRMVERFRAFRHDTSPAPSLAAQNGLVEALKEARRSLKMQEGAEIWNSNCVECDGEGEWTECPICSDAFGKAIDARNATFPLIDAALSAIKGDKS